MARKTAIATLIAAGVLGGAAASAHGPYADFANREIKALSERDVSALLAGKGMALALAAELNGYPGPMHVLELSDELELSDTQRARSAALFHWVKDNARRLGADLVEAERNLDRHFADGTINQEQLTRELASISTLKAELRGIHLQAHLEMKDVLSAQQAAKYAILRGYSPSGEGATGRHGSLHGHGAE